MLFLTSSLVVLVTSSLVVSDAAGGSLLFAGEENVCPGGTSSCDQQATCCAGQTDGQWTCCPLKNAQCCSDGLHCCPQGTRCNNQQSSCDPISTNTTVRAVPKTLPTTPKPAPNDAVDKEGAGIVCPDHKASCPYAGAACCRRYTSTYGCCLYPSNVCCDDGLHCCPVGTVCDQLTLTCIKYPSQDSLQWTRLVASRDVASVQRHPIPAVAAAEERASIICPDGGFCPSGSTCCRLRTSVYGCCPYIAATCCSDGIHCCPHGYRCNSGSCESDGDSGVAQAFLSAVRR